MINKKKIKTFLDLVYNQIEKVKGQYTMDNFVTNLEKHGFISWQKLDECFIEVQTKLKGKNMQNAMVLLESFIDETSKTPEKPNWKNNSCYFYSLFQIQELRQSLNSELKTKDMIFPPWYQNHVESMPYKLWSHTKTGAFEANNVNTTSWYNVKTHCIPRQEQHQEKIQQEDTNLGTTMGHLNS